MQEIIQTIEQKIKEFLEKETEQKIESEDVDLIEKDIVNSFTMLKLIAFIEKEFNIEVKIEELTRKNFNTLHNIARQIKLWKQK